MSPHRERGPQEVTPVRLDAPRGVRPAPPPVAHALPARPVARQAPPPPDAAEVEADVTKVRRRALVTAGYAVGAIVFGSATHFGDGSMGMSFPAFLATAFCGAGFVAGTVWTWLGARRIGDAGISLFDAVDGSWREAAARLPERSRLRAAPPASPASLGARAAAMPALPAAAHRVPATPEVLASRWGGAVTRAVEDRAGIAHLVGELGPADRDMIPDVLPSADALVRRVGELAATLHELDRDAPPTLVADVEARLADARAAVPDGAEANPDQARRIELLRRQLETLADLAARREQLTTRLESAGLVLQTMRLDLLRLRSAGIESALGEITAMTRDAGTLSRDIGRALDVAEELRKAEG